MHNYRITKYDPENRNRYGIYEKNEWTSYSDIGKVFDEKKLSFETYIAVENAYICAVKKILCEMKKKYIILEELEKNTYPQRDDRFDDDMCEAFSTLGNNREIMVSDLEPYLRLILREVIWGKLIQKDLYVHFGYDYCMYFGTPAVIKDSIIDIEENGLYLEENIRSPYL